MRKILFINTNKAWGGGEKWHFKMAQALTREGYQCLFVTYPNSALEIKLKKTNIHFTSIAVTNLSFLNPLKKKKLENFITENKISNIFINLPSDVKFVTSIRNRISEVKLIYRRGMPHPIRSTILNRFFYSRLDKIIANSEEIKKSITQNLPELTNRVKVVYNGIDQFIGNDKKRSKTLIIGNLGRLVPQKGHYHLIYIAKRLVDKRIDNFKIIIGGMGPLQTSLQEAIKKEKLEHCIKLLGHVDPHDFFNQIDLFLFPSHFEGSANSLIEAAQYGIPSIAFNISSMPEMIQNNKTGFLVSAFSEDLMAKKIEVLINNRSSDVFNQQNHKKLINENFLFSEKVKQIKGLINDK